MKTNLILSLFVLLFHFQILQAGISSIRSGSWGDPSTWEAGIVPKSNDDIVVRHHVTKQDDLQTTGGSLSIEDGGMLQVQGMIYLKGLTNLSVAREGAVMCASFRTYTIDGLAVIAGKLECRGRDLGAGKLNIGGTFSMEVSGRMKGHSLDLKGNTELMLQGGHLHLDSSLLVRGYASLGMDKAEMTVKGSVKLETDWDIFFTGSKIRIHQNLLCTQRQTLHLAGTGLHVDGKMTGWNEVTVWVSERGEIVSEWLELSDEASIQGKGSGGIVKNQHRLIAGVAWISNVGANQIFNRDNFAQMPISFDLGAPQISPAGLPSEQLQPAKNKEALKVGVYPNPTNGIINIRGLEPLNSPQFILTNLTGQQERLEPSGGILATIDLNDQYPPGIYNLTIKDGPNRRNIQLILQ